MATFRESSSEEGLGAYGSSITLLNPDRGVLDLLPAKRFVLFEG